MGRLLSLFAGSLALAGLCHSVPLQQSRRSRNILLGSSFGVPGNPYTFDYVVVGGGMAGLTVAARLAEDPSLLIGVVEAGTFYELSNGNFSQVPQTDIQNVGKDLDDWQPGNDWGFATTPQEALLNVPVHYPRGKMLGGSSARNYMTYHLGTKGSYDMWAEEVGDDSYRYENFLPYFTKHQKFTPPDNTRRIANATPSYDPAVLGTKGKLEVIFPNYAAAFGTWVEKGLRAIGMNPIDGFQSGKLIGSAYALATIKYDENIRDSSETAYLQPEFEKANPNLIVFPSTLGKRVLFDENKKANGVEVDTGGLKYVLDVKREVILSAGTFQSPQLLMVSGVGPRETLEQHGIDVVHDLPGVGQNMLDHVLFGTTYRVNVITSSAMGNPDYANRAIEQFKRGKGPMVNPNIDMFGWEKLPRNGTNGLTDSSVLEDLSYFSPDWPEVEYIAPGSYFGYATNFAKDNPTDGYNYASIMAGMVATLSKGNVSISSSDAADPPVIDPNWLSHPADKAVALAAFKRTRQIWESAAMADLTIGDEYFPGKADVSTDEEIWNFIQKSYSPIFHAACTCKMGKETDPSAVLDTRAKVFGVAGLRVVDAASMPLLPPGHPMATIYALAEKIAEDILHGKDS